jgi:hypothetical protein
MELKINLGSIWNKAPEHDDMVARTTFFVKSFFSVLKPAITISLQGEIPSLPLLIAIYLARPYGHTITFTDNHNNTVTLFSKV